MKTFSQFITEEIKQTTPEENKKLLELVGHVFKYMLKYENHSRFNSSTEIQIDTLTNTHLEMSVRYWGEWEVPDGEEDDGDYDWEVLSDKSSLSLKKIKTHVYELKNVLRLDSINIQTAEKNYIILTASKKNNKYPETRNQPFQIFIENIKEKYS